MHVEATWIFLELNQILKFAIISFLDPRSSVLKKIFTLLIQINDQEYCNYEKDSFYSLSREAYQKL